MKKMIFLSFFFYFIVGETIANEVDSVSQITIDDQSSSFIIEQGDTIVDLNKLNGGIIKYQIPEADKVKLEEQGLEILNPGVIVVKNPMDIKSNIQVEIKSFASDEEWYINNIKITKGNSQWMVYIQSDKIEMATGWRKDGKIWVVIAVVFILFISIIGYLFYLDRKINKL